MKDDLHSLRMNLAVGCKVCYYLEVMNINEADAMKNALSQPKVYAHTDLANVFKKNGMPVSEASVRRHRKEHL